MEADHCVVQVNFFSGFVDEDFRKAVEYQQKKRDAAVVTAAVAATAEAVRMSRDQRRAITPASRTTVAGDTGRVLPLAALVLTTVGVAIKAAAPTTRALAAARTRTVAARSQTLSTTDLTEVLQQRLMERPCGVAISNQR